MTEPKRLQFTTVDDKKGGDAPPQEKYSSRFDLPLKDSTDETCPVFSYTELLKNYMVSGKNV